jgi:hypothetical protein
VEVEGQEQAGGERGREKVEVGRKKTLKLLGFKRIAR